MAGCTVSETLQAGIGTNNSPGSTMTRNRTGITGGQEPMVNSIFGKIGIRPGTGSMTPIPNGSPPPGTLISQTPTIRTIKITIPRIVLTIRMETPQTVYPSPSPLTGFPGSTSFISHPLTLEPVKSPCCLTFMDMVAHPAGICMPRICVPLPTRKNSSSSIPKVPYSTVLPTGTLRLPAATIKAQPMTPALWTP